MNYTTSRTRGHSRKLKVAGLAAISVATAACPLAQSAVYAAGNNYDWTKQSDFDLLGGFYTSVASSASGSNLIVGSREGGEGYTSESPLYVSRDYGATWENVTENAELDVRQYWNSVDVTNNGQTMVAASSEAWDLNTFNQAESKMFISHDAGDTWTDMSPAGNVDEWTSVAISGDGSKIVALAEDDHANIYTSSNGGTSWQTRPVAGIADWESASISDDGSKILVGGENGSASSNIYLSINGGTNWTNVSPDNGDMVFDTRTAMSANGGKIAVTTFGDNGSEYGKIQVSTNNGSTWSNVTPSASAANSPWKAIAMSDNGSVLAALTDNSTMYVSKDGGSNWTAENPGFADNDSNNWRSVDFNDTGSRAVVASTSLAYIGYDESVDSEDPDDEGGSETPTTTKQNFTNAETGKAIELTLPSGTTVTCHSPAKESGLTAQDGAYSYPLGLVDFCFSGADSSNEIGLVFVTDLKPNQVAVRKFNPTTKQYATISGATVTETTYGGQHALRVSYVVTDNGPLDTNPNVGEVADPVGLAVLDAGAPDTGASYQSKLPFIAAIAAGTAMTATIFVTQRSKLNALLRSRK